MNNGGSQDYSIGIGSIRIDDANNFFAKPNYNIQDNIFDFVSLGLTGGLSQIKSIPLIGWAKTVAVVPGAAYIARSSNYSYSWGSYSFWGYSYARLYVTDYITGTSGGIIGAIVKYQSPFYGSDEELQLSTGQITLDAYRCDNQGVRYECWDELKIENKNAIVFSVSSNQNWCKARLSSQQKITISCSINTEPSSREAIVTLTTAYGKKACVKVLQKGITG